MTLNGAVETLSIYLRDSAVRIQQRVEEYASKRDYLDDQRAAMGQLEELKQKAKTPQLREQLDRLKAEIGKPVFDSAVYAPVVVGYTEHGLDVGLPFTEQMFQELFGTSLEKLAASAGISGAVAACTPSGTIGIKIKGNNHKAHDNKLHLGDQIYSALSQALDAKTRDLNISYRFEPLDMLAEKEEKPATPAAAKADVAQARRGEKLLGMMDAYYALRPHGYAKSTVMKYVSNGTIRSVEKDGERLVPKSAIADFLKGRKK